MYYSLQCALYNFSPTRHEVMSMDYTAETGRMYRTAPMFVYVARLSLDVFFFQFIIYYRDQKCFSVH